MEHPVYFTIGRLEIISVVKFPGKINLSPKMCCRQLPLFILTIPPVLKHTKIIKNINVLLYVVTYIIHGCNTIYLIM